MKWSQFAAYALFLLLYNLFPISVFATESPTQLQKSSLLELEKKKQDPYFIFHNRRKGIQENFEKCSWLVRYRNRIYDLSPLTRTALARPLQGDLRSAIRRIPEAEQHLAKMEQNLKESRVHTAISSFSLLSFVALRLLVTNQADERKNEEDRRPIILDRGSYNALNIAALFFFARSAFSSWKLSNANKKELATAIEKFNTISPEPIMPYYGEK